MRRPALPGIVALLSIACVSEMKDEADLEDTGTPGDCVPEIWYPDGDGDGYGVEEGAEERCEGGAAWAREPGDCDDSDPTVYPGADEYCNGKDNDCDGRIDDNAVDASPHYIDADLDGYGNPDIEIPACNEEPGLVRDSTDCDDSDPTVHPGADEYCNGTDNDCNGLVDDDALDMIWVYVDEDGDGFGDPGEQYLACEGADNDWDCDDSDPHEPQVVSTSGDPSTADGSYLNPWSTIQEAIDEAQTCVIVFPGTYAEAVDFSGKEIEVTGPAGPEETVIDASSASAPAVSFMTGEGPGAVLDGFTLTGGSGYEEDFEDSYECGSGSWTCYSYTTTWCGGGVFIDGATPTLKDLIITGNLLPEASTAQSGIIRYYYEYSYGGGICARDTSLDLDGLVISSNFADQGGGIWLDEDANVTVSRSWLYSNTATDGAGLLLDGGEATLTNVLSTWNAATDDGGGALAVDALLTGVNVTYGGESADSGGGIRLEGSSTGSFMNSIIYGASAGAGVSVASSATFSGMYNNVHGNTDGEYSGIYDRTGELGNISADPEFVSVSFDGDPLNDDWTLSASSPSVDAGHPSTAYDDPDGTRNNMGAYGGAAGEW